MVSSLLVFLAVYLILFTLSGVPWMQKLRVSLVGAQGYQRFPLCNSKPQCRFEDIYSFACCACLQGFYVPGFCLPGLFNFISPKFLQSSMVECVLYFCTVNGNSRVMICTLSSAHCQQSSKLSALQCFELI